MIAVLAVSMLLGQAAPANEGPANEGPANEGPLLTLDAALQQAGEQNLDLAAARARLAQSRETSRKAWAAYLPQLSVGGSYTRNNVGATVPFPTAYYIRNVFTTQGQPPPGDPTQPVTSTNVPGAPTPYILVPGNIVNVTIQKEDQLGARAQFSQALIAPTLWPAIHNAYLAEDIAGLNVENARRQILFSVAQLYYGAVGLKQAVQIQQRQLEINLAHEKDARVRFEAGAVPKASLLRAEIDRARAEQDLKRAQNSYQSAKVSLATLLVRDTRFSLEMPPEPRLPADLSGLEDTALSDRPDVAAARKTVSVAEGQRTGTWLSYLPSVGLSGLYQLANVQGFTGRYDTWSVTLGLNWTLFDGGLREANLRESYARVTEAVASRRSAELKARADVMQAKLDLDSAVANRAKAAEQLRLARENLQLVDVSFRSGAATYLEVEDAKAALLAAELGAVGEELNSHLAALRLLQVSGLFNP